MTSRSVTTLNHILTFLVYLPLVAIVIGAIALGVTIVKGTSFGDFKQAATTPLVIIGALGAEAWEFIKNNPYRIVVFLISVTYAILSYYYIFGSSRPHLFKEYSRTTNTIWLILAMILSGVVFNLLLKRNLTGSDPYPRDASFLDKTRWALGKSSILLKITIAFALLLALLFLILYLINKFSFLSESLSVLIYVALLIGILFLLYIFTKDNPLVKKWIVDNTLFKFIYQAIFFVPCAFFYAVTYLYDQFKVTPRYVYYTLLVEIVILALYVFTPILAKYLYTYEPDNEGEELHTRREFDAVNNTIIPIQRELKELKGGLGVDWSVVIKRSLYKSENADVLKDYLTGLGYKPASQMGKEGTVLSYVFGKAKSLEAATTYVTTNASLVIKYQDQLKDLVDKRKHIEKQVEEEDQAFTSKVLLDKAVFTDSLRDIGSFENLDADTGDYNYRYALSAWFFIHEQPPNARLANIKFTSLLNYAGKPNILYNVSKKTLQFRMINGIGKEVVVFETQDFPMQRWNNVVVNYDGGTLDIFINKKLVYSAPNIVPYMKVDVVTAGVDDGVSGGIANVTYFSAPLGRRRIELNYDLLKNRKFPII